MRVENIRFWQWMLIGAFVGLMFAVVKVYQGPWFDNADVDTIDQARFERELVNAPDPWRRGGADESKYHKDQPLLKDVVVTPPLGGDAGPLWWVSGKTYSTLRKAKFDNDTKSPIVLVERWAPFKYPAKAPYHATTGSVGTYPTILDYLQVVKKHNPTAVPFAYAWWNKPGMPYLMLPAAGVLVLGFAWPATLNILQSAGMARRREKRVKMAPNRTIVMGVKPAVDTAAARADLDAFNADLETSLGGFGSVTAAAAVTDAEAAVRPMPVSAGVSAAVDAAPKPVEEDEGEKDYDGEFYPVARTAGQKK